MKKKNCGHDKNDVLLLHYGELDPIRESFVRDRLDRCADCASYQAALSELDSIVPRQPSTHPDDALMQAVRSATSRRLQADGTRIMRLRSTRPFRSSLLPRIVIGGVVVAVSFLIGRGSVSVHQQDPLAREARIPGGESFAEVSGITMDPVSGQVRIDVRTEGNAVVEGNVNDTLVQTLLYDALLDRGNPAGRFRTLSLLSELDRHVIEPDPVLVSALSSIIEDETNMGLKLQAARALRRVLRNTPIEDTLRTVLVDVILTADNDALRILVLEILTEGELARQDLRQILNRVTKDDNRFIRTRAQHVLSTLISEDADTGNVNQTDRVHSSGSVTQPLEKIDG